uniref:Uncharacterized protein n=1 Tax=Anguilla anguilla TaxID=7936 RepID=A0A0E9PQV0_ANGAN
MTTYRQRTRVCLTPYRDLGLSTLVSWESQQLPALH